MESGIENSWHLASRLRQMHSFGANPEEQINTHCENILKKIKKANVSDLIVELYERGML